MCRLAKVVVCLAFAGGAGLTVWGLTHLQWSQVLPLPDGGRQRYAIFLVVCSVLIVGGTYWSKRNPIFVGAAIAVGLALLAGALWSLLVTLWFAVAAVIVGGAILKALRVKPDEGNYPLNFLIGAGAYGTLVGIAAHFLVNYPGVYGVVLVLPLLLSGKAAVEQAKSFWAMKAQKTVAGFEANALDTTIAVVILVHFVVALMPEFGFDALWQHLFVAAHLTERHQWGFDAATYVWAVIPMLGDWIFSIGYMLAGETAARLINIIFIFALGWLLRDLVLWSGGSLVGARWAALIFLSTPLTFAVSGSLFIDSVFAAFVVGGTLLVLRVGTPGGEKRSQLIIAALLMGFAFATKAVSFMLLPALLVILIARHKIWLQSNPWGVLAFGIFLFLMLGSVPYINAWWLTGNPVFPFFNKIFQSPLWLPANFEATAFGKGVTWDVLYRVIFHSDKYLEARPGASGFQWLILFLPSAAILLLCKQYRGLALLWVGIVSVFLVFHSTAYLRYIFAPGIILIAAIGAAIFSSSERKFFLKKTFAFGGALVVLINLVFFSVGTVYADFPLHVIFNEESRRQYISRRQPIRTAIDLVNRLNMRRAPVAVFAHPLTAGLVGDALYPDWTNIKFQGEIRSARAEQDLVKILAGGDVDFVILDSNWNEVNCCSWRVEKQALVEKVSEKLATYGSISVRKIRAEYRFKTELLNNSDFTSLNGWSLAVGAKYNDRTRTLRANVSSSASQRVVVTPGRRYLNAVVSRCFNTETLGRIQNNWHDAEGKFISTDIQTFRCSLDWTERAMEVVAPANASEAVVYAVGHTPTMIEFKSISFRQ